MLGRVAVYSVLRDALVIAVGATDLGLTASSVRLGPPPPESAGSLDECIFFLGADGQGVEGDFRLNHSDDEWTFLVGFWTRLMGKDDEVSVMQRAARIALCIDIVLADSRTLATAACTLGSAQVSNVSVVVQSIRATGQRSGPDLAYGPLGAAAAGVIEVAARAVTTFS